MMINTAFKTVGTDERRRRYREMLDFYRGRQRTGREEARLTLNYAAAVVDKLTAYLMNGLSVRVAAADDSAGAKAGARQAQTLIDSAYDASRLELLDYETEIDAAVLGDGCYRLGWDGAARMVRVSAPDVSGLNVDYALDGVTAERVTLAYTVDAAAAAGAWGFTAAGKEVEVVETWTADTFEITCGGVMAAGGDNPYGFIPFIIFPNLSQPRSPWGASDLNNLIEVQRELNRAAGQLSHILELSGNPIAVLENVESSRDIAVSPGAVWHLPEEARAYLLDLLQGGGAQLHISYIDLLFRVLHDLGEMPRAAIIEKEAVIGKLTGSLAGAVAAYRTSITAHHTDVPAELITGDSIADVDESVKRARALVEQVRASLKTAPPPVVAVRRGGSVEAMTTEEKIRRGLGF